MTGFRRGRPEGGGVLLCGLPNLLTNTEDFAGAAWTAQGIGSAAPTVTANAALSPKGTLTADQLDFAAASSGQTSGIYQELTISSAGVYTFSLYVKGVSGSGSFNLLIYDGSFEPVQAIPFTTSWSRFQFSRHLNATVTDIELGFSDAWSGGAGGPASVYLWGAMLNSGAKACAYKAVA